MTTYIQDIVDVDNLTRHIAHGNITERFHPEFPEVVIYNYAPNVQYDNLWDAETKAARGLIVNLDTNEVLARPFNKFFNLGQGDQVFDLDVPLHYIGDKFDGSLGIGFVLPNGEPAIATRGSFTSEQANKANADLLSFECMFIAATVRGGNTPLFEIIYPENRIVLDYGDLSTMVLLGTVQNSTGDFYGSNEASASVELDGLTLREVLELEPRENAEGYVLWFDRQTPVKLKQEDYVELHRVVTNLNRKTIWEWARGNPLEYPEKRAQLPDELYTWADEVWNDLQRQYAERMLQIDTVWLELCDQWYVLVKGVIYGDGEVFDRGGFARLVNEIVPAAEKRYMFKLLDSQPIDQLIWAELEPKGGTK